MKWCVLSDIRGTREAHAGWSETSRTADSRRCLPVSRPETQGWRVTVGCMQCCRWMVEVSDSLTFSVLWHGFRPHSQHVVPRCDLLLHVSCLSVCLSVCYMREPCKMVEPINMTFWVAELRDPQEPRFCRGAHWCDRTQIQFNDLCSVLMRPLDNVTVTTCFLLPKNCAPLKCVGHVHAVASLVPL